MVVVRLPARTRKVPGRKEALLIPSKNLRALMIEEPELGERIMRTLILRRVALIEAGAGGPVLIGPASSPDVIRLQGFLARNAYPHQLLDPMQDRDAAELAKRYATNPADLPLAVCPKGSILKNPNETELAHALGMVPIEDGRDLRRATPPCLRLASRCREMEERAGVTLGWLLHPEHKAHRTPSPPRLRPADKPPV
jgi:hypothetical protein